MGCDSEFMLVCGIFLQCVCVCLKASICLIPQVFADKEVILSGGAINSPQLLMLSGVGDANHLQELGIPVVQHLPGGLISTLLPLCWLLHSASLCPCPVPFSTPCYA